jgi:hypothetical protein
MYLSPQFSSPVKQLMAFLLHSTTQVNKKDSNFIKIFRTFSAIQKLVQLMKNAVFWNVAPWRSCVNQRFGGTYRLHLQGRKIRKQGTSMSRWLAVCKRWQFPSTYRSYLEALSAMFMSGDLCQIPLSSVLFHTDKTVYYTFKIHNFIRQTLTIWSL